MLETESRYKLEVKDVATITLDIDIIENVLTCRDQDLVTRIATSIKEHPDRYRIVDYAAYSDGPNLLINTISGFCQKFVWEEFFDIAFTDLDMSQNKQNGGYKLNTGHQVYLKESCCSKVASGKENDGEVMEGHRKGETLVCRLCKNDTKEHKRKNGDYYLYHIGDDSYCGSCLDKAPTLKFQFTREHESCYLDWEIREDTYRHRCVDDDPDDYADEYEVTSETVESWGLKEDEFWAKILYCEGLEGHHWEAKFIGVGPRREEYEASKRKTKRARRK